MQTLVTLLEQARSLDRDRLELDRQSKKIKDEVDKLCAEIVQGMKAQGIDSLNGARIQVKQKPFISDWNDLSAYIRKYNAVDLLQKRLTESAVKLRWDDGIQIPGVGLAEEEKLQLK